MKLTVASIKAAKPADRPYKLGDGAGLHLQVNPNGARWWRYRYRFDGREKMISLGTYPATSLKEARNKRDDYRKLLERDPPIDPSAERRANRQSQANTLSIVTVTSRRRDVIAQTRPYRHRQSAQELEIALHLIAAVCDARFIRRQPLCCHQEYFIPHSVGESVSIVTKIV